MARSTISSTCLLLALLAPGATSQVLSQPAAPAPQLAPLAQGADAHASRYAELSTLGRALPGPLGWKAGVPASALFDAFHELALDGHGPSLAWCARHLAEAPPHLAGDPAFGAELFLRLLLEHADDERLLEPGLDPLRSLQVAPEAVRVVVEGALAGMTAGETVEPLALLLRATALAPREAPDPDRTARALALLRDPEQRFPEGPLRRRAAALAWRLVQLAPGAEAPELLLHDVDGNELRLSDWRGKLVLVDVWDLDDGDLPARIERRRALLARHAGAPLSILAVGRASDAASFRRGLEELDVGWPTAFAGGGAAGATLGWRLEGGPSRVLIDAQGTIRAVGLEGPRLEGVIERLLAPQEVRAGAEDQPTPAQDASHGRR